MKKKKTSLVQDFAEYFSLELATTLQQKEKVYSIRYRVYCEEFGYEAADAFPNKQEVDEFDVHSLHCLVMHKNSGRAAGCVRVVKVDNALRMPMEKYCSESIDESLVSSLGIQRSSMCEFSRLAVDGAFRRRAGEQVSRFGEISSMDCSKREMRTFSLIAVATFLGAFAVSDLVGRTNAFAMMEPFLPRLLRRSGIVVKRCGEDTDYHGVRAPYYITTQDAVAGMSGELRELYEIIHATYAKEFTPAPKVTTSGAPSRIEALGWNLYGLRDFAV